MRKFVPFDRETINAELLALPKADFLALTKAMDFYQHDLEIGYRVSQYEGDIWMITDAGRGQGRGLFFMIERTGDKETLILLKVYKKETQKAPARHIATAKQRQSEYLRKTDDDETPST